MKNSALPQEFIIKYKALLGDEADDFFSAFNDERTYGIRFNTLKTDKSRFGELYRKIFDAELSEEVYITWSEAAFRYDESARPGKNRLYHCGLYYIQDPAAMLPAAAADIKPGMKVLDLCAAPGGKTVQLAGRLKGQGLLYANDISASRIKALIKNIELAGIRCASVLNETPERLAEKFPRCFDAVLADVPCSGEGMFRKDFESIRGWSRYGSEKLAKTQYEILSSAAVMTAPGGSIIYSTCTYAPEENEQVIEHFLREHCDFTLEPIGKVQGVAPGRTDWTLYSTPMEDTARMWPHIAKAEGQFAAKLRRSKEAVREVADITDAEKSKETDRTIIGRNIRSKPVKSKNESFQKASTVCPSSEMTAAYERFSVDVLGSVPNAYYFSVGNGLYSLPEAPLSPDGLKVCKFGFYLGSMVKDSFVPSHSLALALDDKGVKSERLIQLESDSNAAESFLRCETPTFEIKGDNGWYLVALDGYGAGWIKKSGEMLKNMYPAGWRRGQA